MKKIAIIGVTGSIGKSTIEVVRRHPDRFRIALATAHSNPQKLIELKKELNIEDAVLTDPENGAEKNSAVLYGQEELFRLLAEKEYDVVINAVSGSAGLVYSYQTLKNKHALALANKESLVLAGHILTKMSDRILPVDSEHSALFQVMSGLQKSDVKNLILTASGGPFLDTPLDRFSEITPKQALNHPTWSMGAKITIDSATMFNKGLEVIEAHWLFGIEYSRIKAVIHPQSIIHSCVECKDGSILSQMSRPSMQLPILYALSYPDHIESDVIQTNMLDLPPLTFCPIEKHRYPLYFLTLEAGKAGGLMPSAMNAANEAAIKLFLENKIPFTGIYRIVADYLNSFTNIENPDIDTILEANSHIFEEVYNSK